MLILTGAEKFKTEEERDKVINNLPDMSDPNVIAEIPANTTVDDFAKQVEKNAMIAMEATIDPETGKTFEELTGAKPAPEVPPKQELPPENTPPQESPPADDNKKPNESATPQQPAVPKFDQEVFERRIAKMQSEYEEKLKEKESDIEKLRRETEEKLKTLAPAVEEKPDIDPNVESKLKEKISRSKQIAAELAKTDDMLGDAALALQKESALINAEINDLSYAKTNAIYESARKKIKAAQEATTSAVQTIKEQQEADAKKAAEKAAADERSKELKEYHDMMDSFKANVPSFKDSRPYSEMERDYVNFSAKVASIYLGDKLPEETTPEEREVAYAKYAKGVPALMEKIKESGVEPPKDLSTYAMLSEVGALYGGSEFDPETGQWRDRVNSRGVKVGYPTVKEAYSAYLMKIGKTENDIIAAQRKAVDEYRNATDTRSNPVELGQNDQQGTVEDMTQEQALKIMNDPSFDTQNMVLIARAGNMASEAEKVILSQFNKAMRTLGIPELTEES